jgi:hypothetical protein
MSSDYFLNKNLNGKEEDFVRELNMGVMSYDNDRFNKFLEKNNDKLYLICEMINIASNEDPKYYTNAIFTAITRKPDRVKLLVDKFKESVKPAPVAAPELAPVASPEPAPAENNWKFWQKKQGGRRKSKKQRKSRKQRN